MFFPPFNFAVLMLYGFFTLIFNSFKEVVLSIKNDNKPVFCSLERSDRNEYFCCSHTSLGKFLIMTHFLKQIFFIERQSEFSLMNWITRHYILLTNFVKRSANLSWLFLCSVSVRKIQLKFGCWLIKSNFVALSGLRI